MSESPSAPQIGRNEPCPCGSKKKYKRCCGMDAAPKLTSPATNPLAAGGGGMPGFDPSQFDPQMLQQFSQMMARLPKGQLQKLQGLMQKAMAGKDVTREAKEFENTLPVDLQSMLGSFGSMGGIGGGGAMPGMEAPMNIDASGGMSEEEARAIVEAAAKDGKIAPDQAQELLKEPKGISKIWKKISGKTPS